MDKAALSNRMSAMMTSRERSFAMEAEMKLKEISPSVVVGRLLAKYGPVSTTKNYLVAIALCLRWLKGKGVTMFPDELVKDK
jgi:hypothetical protein